MPRIPREERLPNPMPHMLHSGWESEYAAKTYLWHYAHDFDIELKTDLDALVPQSHAKGDYWVHYQMDGDAKKDLHVLDVKQDISHLLHASGVEGSIESTADQRTPNPTPRMKQPEYIGYSEVIFAGSDKHGRRDLAEEHYDGEIIIADQDAPDHIPTYSEYMATIKPVFEHLVGCDGAGEILQEIRDHDMSAAKVIDAIRLYDEHNLQPRRELKEITGAD